MQIISVPKSLREKLGEEGADALIEILNQAQTNQKNDIIELVGEKFERRLSEEISALRKELKEDNAALRTELKEDIASLSKGMHSMRTEMHSIRADLIKWMFIFWVGQVATILGILFVFFR